MLGNTVTGGKLIVDCLEKQDVDLLFQLPGESFLSVLNALHDSEKIRVITCRHESGAANMAEAYGKITGRPGIAFVTRGPGACHASVGVHTADQDSTPMILFIGQVPTTQLGRRAFQEVDIEAMFGWCAKFAANIPSADRIPEFIARAFHLAVSGRPGPVVLGLPEDIQIATTDAAAIRSTAAVQTTPGQAELDALCAMLERAERPMMMIGGSGWTQAACDAMVSFARHFDLPTCVTFRRQDHFDTLSQHYVGDLAFALDPGLSSSITESDLILAVGARLGELATGGFRLISPPKARQKLIHVHAEAAELGRIFQPDLAINASPFGIANALTAIRPHRDISWHQWSALCRSRFAQTREAGICPGPVDMNSVMKTVTEQLDEDAIIVTDAGNFAQWVQRFYPFRKLGTQVGPRGGAMGYGVPAAIAAKAVAPERQVVAFVGDGGFMMTSNELATAMQYTIAPVIVVVNNGTFGTIRAHQERQFPGRISGTGLSNPDFGALARACGAWSATVTHTDAFAPAFAEALKQHRPSIIDLHLDREAITASRTLTEIRNAALARLG